MPNGEGEWNIFQAEGLIIISTQEAYADTSKICKKKTTINIIQTYIPKAISEK